MKEQKKKVVIADDEASILGVLKEILSETYEVFTATNGSEAAAIARKVKPDLVMLDILMPGRDGLDACKELKNDRTTRSIPVIILTAMMQTEHIAKGFAAGADAYIAKPFLADKLLEKVKSVIEKAEMKLSLGEEKKENTKI